MKTSAVLRTKFYPPTFANLYDSTANPSFFIPIKTASCLKHPTSHSASRIVSSIRHTLRHSIETCHMDKPLALKSEGEFLQVLPHEYSRFLLIGAVSVGFALLFMGLDDQKALALGPEGPLVEEFWENVRRYALYALTVSTGALYTILLPIFELLKNPISAILLLMILGGSIFVISQVLSAMVGVTEFNYDYSY
ncbi:uncharacterized protein LOC123192870 [Mangifera indica]|uniref:uncharacterized protein LOC123192870 n=1 Tax=Mangifera indica TaxID=29780 RepID=UPI001CF9AC81|nr:uncharacterized protein LOC123192870 [Mangifera indica]